MPTTRPARCAVSRPALMVIAGALLAVACTQAPVDLRDHPLASTRLWQQYTKLPEARALAVAGDPSRIWVAGMAGGLPSLDAARREALAECGRQRTRRRMQAPCLVYAEGASVVWGVTPGTAPNGFGT